MHYGTFRQSLFALALLGGIACAQAGLGITEGSGGSSSSEGGNPGSGGSSSGGSPGSGGGNESGGNTGSGGASASGGSVGSGGSSAPAATPARSGGAAGEAPGGTELHRRPPVRAARGAGPAARPVPAPAAAPAAARVRRTGGAGGMFVGTKTPGTAQTGDVTVDPTKTSSSRGRLWRGRRLAGSSSTPCRRCCGTRSTGSA